MQVIRGADFQICEQYLDLYLEYKLVESHVSWKEKWFYIEDHKPSLPKITGHHAKYSSRWLDEPTTAESIQVPHLLTKIAVLKKQGLTGVVIDASFLKRRQQPLQFRQTPAYEYSGLDDPSRMSPDVSDEEVGGRLRRMFKELEGALGAVEEFDSRNKPNEATSEVVEAVEAAAVEVVGTAERATNNADEVAEIATDDGTVAADMAACNVTMAPETTTLRVIEEVVVTAGSVAGSTETYMSEAVKTPKVVSDATLSEISGGRERMDTSGNPVVAAAQVLLWVLATTLKLRCLPHQGKLLWCLIGLPSEYPGTVFEASSSVDLGAAGTNPAADDESRSTTNPAPAPVIELTEENLAPADVIGSLQDVASAAPQTAAPGPLPEAASVEEPSALDVLDIVPLNSAGTEAPELEAACTLGFVAAAIGTSSEAGPSFSQELDLVPGAKNDSAAEHPSPRREIEAFESPLLESQAICSILEMNQRIVAYTKDMFKRSHQNVQLLREQSEVAHRVELLEKEISEECRRTAQFLEQYDSVVASFQVERR
uniref:Uncharacterized protein n=1 Tax=Setaria viridis TaxID=4556 RepID=A0A4U6VB41_SETVI|nr:hypothetical protein SEVIR_3G198100v2 [Setaria viridis]